MHDNAVAGSRARRRCGRRSAFLVLLGACFIAACGPPPAPVLSPEATDEGTVFRYRDPVAHVVQISGSWASNFYLRGREWTSDTRVGRMTRRDDGVWELRVPLGPGRYEYVFLVDGRFWKLDPSNPQRGADGQGGWVSLLVVP